MTDFNKRVTRRTMGAYRMTVTGAIPCPTGKRLCVTLHQGDNGEGDFITIREAGRRYRVTLNVAELYRRGMLADTARQRKAGRHERESR